MKLCWRCKHFSYFNGTGPYSDVTPGEDFQTMCERNHWMFSARRTTQEEFGKILSTADTCEDYKKMDM